MTCDNTSVTCLLLVEIISDIVLHCVTISTKSSLH